MNKNLLFYLLLVIAMVFWGASWPSSKVMVSYIGAEVITFWRFFFALLASIPIVILLKIPLRLDTHTFKFLILAALCNCLYSFMYFIGLNYGSAGKGGVLVTTLIPIFAYLLTFSLYKLKKNSSKKMKKNEILGLFLGVVAGICLLNLGSWQELFGKFNTLFVFCALDWAILTLICRNIGIHPVAINLYITFFSLLFFSPIFFFQPAMFEVFYFDARFWWMMFIVAVLSTAVGTSIYYMGVARVGAAQASSFNLLIPVTALLSSFVILGEIPSVLTFIGGSMAVFAAYLINLYQPKHFGFKLKNNLSKS
ncbi:DMT family transporter [uncultured Helicobacter sp.]|uniref:DMT family transporter n=1 Tax=uncultured Helicobacter sp. TaxID=175537 RepID=UPI00261A1A63|nr:DMT family transporter [uncultured Helicobacter sp.]